MGRFLQIIGNTFLVQQLYGSKYTPNIGRFFLPYVYVKAMLFAAGADELHPAERHYVQGLVETLLTGCDPQSIENRLELTQFIEAVPKRQSKGENISSFLSGSTLASPVLSRVLLYDAIRSAAADGEFSAEEQDHVMRVSKQLGIPESVKMSIESICRREMELNARKERLLRRCAPAAEQALPAR